MAILRRTHTLAQMPKNLTLVVVTLKSRGALPVVVIINRLALKELPVRAIPHTDIKRPVAAAVIQN